MPAFRYCQDNRPVVEYLRNRNRTVLSDVFQSRGLTSKQNCRSLFAYAVIRPRRAKEPFNAVIEGEDDRPVQAAASWFLRQVTGAGPVSQSFDKSMDVGGDGKIWNVPCEGVMPNLEFHFPGGAVGTIIGSHLIAGDDGDGCKLFDFVHILS